MLERVLDLEMIPNMGHRRVVWLGASKVAHNQDLPRDLDLKLYEY